MIYALQHIVKHRDPAADWIMIVDDDVYVNMERITRLLGAMNESAFFYGFDGGPWGQCLELGQEWLPSDWKQHEPFVRRPPKLERFLFPVWAVNGGAGHVSAQVVPL